MPDQRFFPAPKPLSLAEIAKISQAEFAPGADPARMIAGVAPLDQAGAGDLTFLDNVKYRAAFEKTASSACILHPDRAKDAPAGVSLLLSKNPYRSYALAAQALYPRQIPVSRIADSARVDASAKIGKGCIIEEGVVIGAGAEIGQGCWFEPYAVIGAGVVIGDHCRIGAHVSVSHALIGHHVRLYPGVRVGQDGFGFAADPKGHVKIPQLGRVIIGDHVEIGANTCIDRGAGPDTVIGDGTWIDNLVQIGHNVKIGRGCIIVSQVGISGSTVVEDFVALGGQVGLAGHITVGQGARIGAQAGVMRDVPAGEEYIGSPAMPIKQFMRQIIKLNHLIKKEKSS